jgi:phosphoglycerate dehydrogenase-like enzyme
VRVTVLDDYQRIALGSADWSAVTELGTVDVVDAHIAEEDELAARLADSDVVVAMRERTPFPAGLLARLPRLRLLVTAGAANAAIDVGAAAERGITVCGTISSATEIPEITFGLIIAVTRHIVAEDAAVRVGRWQHTIGPSLRGSTLGVVGLGKIGIPVARIGQAFGMRVIAWSPNLTAERALPHDVRAVAKEELFGEADIITVHMPLSDRSRGLVGKPEFARMKPTAYLINTSRGPIVDEQALVTALRERRIAGAGLDVYDVEPLPARHPLRSLPNTVVLPHIGYVTLDRYREWYTQVVEDIVAWSAGCPVRVLNPPAVG